MACRRISCALALLLFVAGCGGGGGGKLTLYPVSGKITVGGKPLAGCNVQFANAGFGYSGKTGPDGSYSLADISDQRPGVAPGKYKVVLQASAEAAYEAMKAGTYGAGKGGTAAFPSEYGKADTSPKEVEVKAEANIINIDIP